MTNSAVMLDVRRCLGHRRHLTHESDADMFADRLEAARQPITSPIAVFETAFGLCRKRHASVEEARDDVRAFLETARIHVVGISAREAEAALTAFARYGKGRGHPAQLNLGDCFAYACAKAYRVLLLFKGDDFGHSDIPAAWGQYPPDGHDMRRPIFLLTILILTVLSQIGGAVLVLAWLLGRFLLPRDWRGRRRELSVAGLFAGLYPEVFIIQIYKLLRR